MLSKGAKSATESCRLPQARLTSVKAAWQFGIAVLVVIQLVGNFVGPLG
jgi:hypothetical protein